MRLLMGELFVYALWTLETIRSPYYARRYAVESMHFCPIASPGRLVSLLVETIA